MSAIGRRKLAAVGALAFALLAAALLWHFLPKREAAPAAPTATAQLKIDPNLGGKPTPVPQEPGVAIRGWRSMLLPSGVTEVDTALNNPEENEGLYYLTYQLVGYTVSDALAALDPDCAKEIANHNELFVQAMIDLDNTLRAHIVRNQTIRVRGENGGDVSVFAAEYGLTNAPDDNKAIELDPIANATEQTYIDRMLENAEKLH